MQEQVRPPAALAGRQSTHTVTAGLSRWHMQAIHPHCDSRALKVATRRQSTHTLTVWLQSSHTQTVAASAAPAAPALPPLLAVDPKRLRADAELERMFGRRALGAEDREEGQGARSQHHTIMATPRAHSCAGRALSAVTGIRQVRWRQA